MPEANNPPQIKKKSLQPFLFTKAQRRESERTFGRMPTVEHGGGGFMMWACFANVSLKNIQG